MTLFWSDFFGKNPSESWGFQIPKMKLWNFGTFLLFLIWYCWWKKCCTSWYGQYPIICMVLYIPGGCLGFVPSKVTGQWIVTKLSMSLKKDGLGLRLKNPLPNFLNSGFGNRKIWLYSVGCDLATVKRRTAGDWGDVFFFFASTTSLAGWFGSLWTQNTKSIKGL